MKIRMLTSLALVLTLFAGQMALAGPGEGGGKGKRMGKMGKKGKRMRGGGADKGMKHLARMLGKLDLSTEQKKKLIDIKRSHKQTQRDIRSTLGTKQEEVFDMTTASKLDEAALNKLADEIGSLHAKKLKARFKFLKQVRGVLSPDQITKINFHLVWGGGERRRGKGGDGL